MATIIRGGLLLLVLVSGLLKCPVEAAVRKGEQAPPLNLATSSGQQISLAQYKGKVLLLDFFATWCIPCREAIPHLNSLSKTYGKQGLQVLGLTVDELEKHELRAFVADRKITYPVAPAGDAAQADYGLRSIPTVYVINKQGIVAEKFMGFSETTDKKMEAVIKKLLAE